jgi:hypothetical protein
MNEYVWVIYDNMAGEPVDMAFWSKEGAEDYAEIHLEAEHESDLTIYQVKVI